MSTRKFHSISHPRLPQSKYYIPLSNIRHDDSSQRKRTQCSNFKGYGIREGEVTNKLKEYKDRYVVLLGLEERKERNDMICVEDESVISSSISG